MHSNSFYTILPGSPHPRAQVTQKSERYQIPPSLVSVLFRLIKDRCKPTINFLVSILILLLPYTTTTTRSTSLGPLLLIVLLLITPAIKYICVISKCLFTVIKHLFFALRVLVVSFTNEFVLSLLNSLPAINLTLTWKFLLLLLLPKRGDAIFDIFNATSGDTTRRCLTSSTERKVPWTSNFYSAQQMFIISIKGPMEFYLDLDPLLRTMGEVWTSLLHAPIERAHSMQNKETHFTKHLKL